MTFLEKICHEHCIFFEIMSHILQISCIKNKKILLYIDICILLQLKNELMLIYKEKIVFYL